MSEKITIELTKSDREFMYIQLQARKQDFEEQMMVYAERKETKEVLRCANAISWLDKLMNQLLGN